MDSGQAARAAGTVFARSAALAGMAAFLVFSVITQSLMNNAPSATESSQKIFSYLVLHQGQLQASAVLAALAALAVLVWVSALFRAARSIEGRTTGPALATFGGGVLTAASTVTLALIGGTTATRLHDLGPAGARVFWTMIELSRGAILVGLLVVIGATALICLRIEPFRWFAVPSAMVAIVSAIGVCTIGYTTPWIQAVAGWAIVIDGLWIFLVGVSLAAWNRPDTASGPRNGEQGRNGDLLRIGYDGSEPLDQVLRRLDGSHELDFGGGVTVALHPGRPGFVLMANGRFFDTADNPLDVAQKVVPKLASLR